MPGPGWTYLWVYARGHVWHTYEYMTGAMFDIPMSICQGPCLTYLWVYARVTFDISLSICWEPVFCDFQKSEISIQFSGNKVLLSWTSQRSYELAFLFWDESDLQFDWYPEKDSFYVEGQNYCLTTSYKHWGNIFNFKNRNESGWNTVKRTALSKYHWP